MKNNHEIITTLLKRYNEQTNKSLLSNPTFLEVIGRSYDEDLISRILAYMLLTDKKLFGAIVGFNFKCEAIQCKLLSVECEKSMCGGRADIFAIAEDEAGKRYTLTIENKIRTWEHDDQTETYFKFINNQRSYKNCVNIFIYIKPDFNASQPICKKFEVLKYSQLLDLIKIKDDTIINDFRQHITRYLRNNEVKIMDTDAFVLRNYKVLKEIMNSAEGKFENFKQQLAAYIYKKNVSPELDYNPLDGRDTKRWSTINEGTLVGEHRNGSLRIYRKDKWYHKDENLANKYYFYVELKFCDNAPNEILVQQVVKCYGNKKESIVVKFLDDVIIPNPQHSGEWWGQYYVIQNDRFQDNEHEMFSPEWSEALKKFAVDKLSLYITEMESIFAEFEKSIKI